MQKVGEFIVRILKDKMFFEYEVKNLNRLNKFMMDIFKELNFKHIY